MAESEFIDDAGQQIPIDFDKSSYLSRIVNAAKKVVS